VLARRELVQRLAAQFAVPLSDEALLRLTGDESPVSPTAPRLRHAIMQLATANAAQHRPVRASQISQLLAAETPEIKTVIKQVTAAVARHSQLSVGELKSKSRQQSIADARGLAMFIARRLTQASYAEIGRHFGNRDHSTVLHSCRKFDRQTKRDEDCRRQVEELIAQIAAGESG
jgi:chromosomal replication initiator protein